MNKIEIYPQNITKDNDIITVSAIINDHQNQDFCLWYKIPVEYAEIITDKADPFVNATIFLAMQTKSKLIVHGKVSASLIDNLREFQLFWNCWRPTQYYPIEIEADMITDSEINYCNKQAIAAFSGGVDSCFTLWKNQQNQQYKLETCLMMIHGFALQLNKKDLFDKAKEKYKLILDNLGLKLIFVATNVRDLNQQWEDMHGAALTSCFLLFENRYNQALIPSSFPYNRLKLPWGTNPITDHLLSNNNLKIIHDGASYSRLEKISSFSNLSIVWDNLQVCWEGEKLDKNCGKCEKCIRTILAFRSLTNQIPKCFDSPPNDQEIRDLKINYAHRILEFKLILQQAKKSGISDSWVSALAQCIINNERRLFLKNIKQKILQKFPQLVKLRSLLP